MAQQNLQKTVLAIRDQLGSLDSTNVVGVWEYDESVGIEEGPTKITTTLLGNAFILNHPTNGILNTNLLGTGTLGATTIQRVVNPNNVFHEHFRDTWFKDTTNTTASWDTTDFRIEFIGGDVAQTDTIFKNIQDVNTVKIRASTFGVKSSALVDTSVAPGGMVLNVT